MPFIALQAVKIFILKSSNKWNFPLAEVPNIFFCSQTESRGFCDSDSEASLHLVVQLFDKAAE